MTPHRLPWLDGKGSAFLPRISSDGKSVPYILIARDLSKIVRVRPGGQFDLYLSSQK